MSHNRKRSRDPVRQNTPKRRRGESRSDAALLPGSRRIKPRCLSESVHVTSQNTRTEGSEGSFAGAHACAAEANPRGPACRRADEIRAHGLTAPAYCPSTLLHGLHTHITHKTHKLKFAISHTYTRRHTIQHPMHTILQASHTAAISVRSPSTAHLSRKGHRAKPNLPLSAQEKQL